MLENVLKRICAFTGRKKNLSQEKLSALLDKNINYINMVESGKSMPTIAMIEKLPVY